MGDCRWTRIYLIGSQSGGCNDRVVEGKFYARKLLTLFFVWCSPKDHSQYLRFRVVQTLHIAVALGVAGAGGDFSNAQNIKRSV